MSVITSGKVPVRMLPRAGNVRNAPKYRQAGRPAVGVPEDLVLVSTLTLDSFSLTLPSRTRKTSMPRT